MVKPKGRQEGRPALKEGVGKCERWMRNAKLTANPASVDETTAASTKGPEAEHPRYMRLSQTPPRGEDKLSGFVEAHNMLIMLVVVGDNSHGWDRNRVEVYIAPLSSLGLRKGQSRSPDFCRSTVLS